MLILGSGAIACEMAQAFSRLGCRVTMVFRGKGLLWREDREVGGILEQCFEDEGIALERNAVMQSFEHGADGVSLTLENGKRLVAEKVLCALGRRFDPQPMCLEKAGIACNARGITVDRFLRTSGSIFMPAAMSTVSISFRTPPCIKACWP